MATIWERAPGQFLVRVRRNGKSQSRTFPTRAEAAHWGRIIEGKLTGDEPPEGLSAKDTSFTQALDWYERTIIPRTPKSAKNKLSQVRYWRESEFATWSLQALKPWDLIEWRRQVLDEDNQVDGDPEASDPLFSTQTCVHRLNLISHLYREWSLVHCVSLDNPVVAGVRPSLDNQRERRLDPNPDKDGRTEQDRLYEACDRSKSPWLGAAIRLAIETCMRQAELAGVTVDRIFINGDLGYIDLPKTKNDRPRRVPLSSRAVAAVRMLHPELTNKGSKRKLLPIETPRAIGHAFRAAVSEEQFPDLRWHDLRHEAISRLFELTDLRDHEIMAVSGHLSSEMLARYTHLRSHTLAARLG